MTRKDSSLLCKRQNVPLSTTGHPSRRVPPQPPRRSHPGQEAAKYTKPRHIPKQKKAISGCNRVPNTPPTPSSPQPAAPLRGPAYAAAGGAGRRPRGRGSAMSRPSRRPAAVRGPPVSPGPRQPLPRGRCRGSGRCPRSPRRRSRAGPGRAEPRRRRGQRGGGGACARAGLEGGQRGPAEGARG